MLRVSIISLIFLTAHCAKIHHMSEVDESVESSLPPAATDEPVFTLEIPEYVIIEYHNATDYIADDNVKQHVMGVSDERCDNANYNLFVDFDPKNETEVEANTKCFENSLYPVDENIQPLMVMMQVPYHYVPVHRCMKIFIQYSERIPLIGPHRPLWGRYGEYLYLPPQRWLHNIEHGGIVLLYHPCADPGQLQLFKDLVKKCLYRHVITPYTKLTKERPFALLGWTASLEFARFDFELSKSFIRYYAKSGPERLFRDGQYKHLLIAKAELASDRIDSKLCPNL